MRFILFILLLSYGMSILLKHPNSMKKTIDYTKSGSNWPGICKSGSRQSPISIDKFNKIDKNVLKLKYGKPGGNLNWNGSFFKIDVADDSSKAIFTDMKKKPPKDIEYVLKRAIFRTPPEHIIEGKVEDIEMQLVHESPDKKEPNNLLIISVFGKVTSNSKMFDDWWKNIEIDPKTKSTLEGIDKTMNNLKDYLFYEGSQTVPNCVENANWIVFRKAMLMDKHLLNSFKRNFCELEFPQGNARHIQNSANREVVQYNMKEG